MVKNINVNELIFSYYFVDCPVDKVNEKISNETTKNKIILSSGRGTGKSVVLKSREKSSIKTESPAFLAKFAGEGIFGSKDNEYFNSEIMEHYYEIVMADKFINYVKLNYPAIFYSRFKRLATLSENKIKEIDKYINNVIYDGRTLDNKLVSGELVEEAVKLFKKEAEVKDITLMIDRFDWTHNSDPRVQSILQNYFSLFDKTIITADDPAVVMGNRTKELEKKGYEIANFSYSNDPDFVREIVQRRILFDDEQKIKFPVEDLSDADFENIVKKCNGNISNVLEVFMYLESTVGNEPIRNLSQCVDNASEDKCRVYSKYRKMYTPPKLHL